ncbi:MAG: aspartate 1-decarboxylase [Actinomycetota bacterium]|nr:aspartate 1-decarboxylase [Actinomycetota bacterium]
MLRTFMRSKIHRATVTDSNLDYVGSLTLAPELLDSASIGVNELIQVVNINNGARFETYTILGAAGANEVVVNGAASRLVERGDKVIIIAYAQLDEHELDDFESFVVHVDDKNCVNNLPESRPLLTYF